MKSKSVIAYSSVLLVSHSIPKLSCSKLLSQLSKEHFRSRRCRTVVYKHLPTQVAVVFINILFDTIINGQGVKNKLFTIPGEKTGIFLVLFL